MGVDHAQGFHLGEPAPLSDWLPEAEARRADLGRRERSAQSRSGRSGIPVSRSFARAASMRARRSALRAAIASMCGPSRSRAAARSSSVNSDS